MSIFTPLFQLLSGSMGQSTDAYCDIETVEDDVTLVDRDGGLLSLIELHGTRQLIGRDDLLNMTKQVSTRLSSLMGKRGHQCDFHHIHEPTTKQQAAHGSVAMHSNAQRAAAKILRMEMDDVLQSRQETMLKFCHEERTFLVLRTNLNVLFKDDLASARKQQRTMDKGLPFPPHGHPLQNYLAAFRGLLPSHRSFVKRVESEFSGVGMRLSLLTCRQALKTIRAQIDPEWTSHNWNPLIPGDAFVLRKENGFARMDEGPDLADLMHPSLARQLYPREIGVLGFKTMQVGSRIYRGLSVVMPPASPESFGRLLTTTRETAPDMPWRISFRVVGGGLDVESFNVTMASLFTIASSKNRAINDGVKVLKEIARKGGAICGMTIDLATWSDVRQPHVLDERASGLARAVQSWGNVDVSAVTGNVAEVVTSTIPGLRIGSVSPMCLPPLDDALFFTPITRPASPWNLGNMLLRSEDGKPFPYRACSKEQDAWVTLVFAPMGGGKSVALNALNVGLVLDPENTTLPWIRNLDIGTSSSGAISLIKHALPPDQRHMVGYYRLKNTREYSINPCDTPLGCRKPLPAHRAYLLSLMSALTTPLDGVAPYDGVVAVLDRCIEIAFDSLGGKGQRTYSPASELTVDAAIDAHRIHIDDRTTWWELVDELHAKGDKHAASAAQRCAVPTLMDIGSAAMSEAVRVQFQDAKTPNGESLSSYVNRTINAALSIYPMIADRTVFDIGDVRILSLDLQDVAPKGSPAADRQTAIMYMVSMWKLMGDFAISEEDLPYVAEKYREEYRRLVDENKRVRKRVCADEFHRTRPAPAARQGIIDATREGRKWKVEIILASQMLNDFDEEMLNLAFTIFVMGAGNNGAKQVAERFGLDDSGAAVIQHRLRGPTSAGSNMLGIFKTKSGTYTHLLTLTLSPVELWAYNTSSEDRAIRDFLYTKMAPPDARRILATIFPGGSAKDEIERRVKSRVFGDSGSTGDGDIIDAICNELLAQAPAMLRKAA